MKGNRLIEKFIKDNDFSIKTLEDSKTNIKEKISDVVDKNGIYKNPTEEEICITDIIGNNINGNDSENILEELEELFTEDKNGNKYSSRSNTMLEYTSENILQGLSESFKKEPIDLSEIKKDKYLINSNGRHRCALLKAHYLKELSKCRGDVEIENLKLKYTIPVKVERLDVIKTYSRYLLKLAKIKNSSREELDDNYLKTGRIIMTDDEGDLKIYSDEELIEYVKDIIDKIPESELKNSIPRLYSKEEYFKQFVDANLKETCIDNAITEWVEKNSKEREKTIDIKKEREN